MPISIRSGPPHIPRLDPQTALSSEANAHTIQSLEAQIQHHGKETIRLKRLRNSLLNVSVCLAPEILGYIFWWRVISGVSASGKISGNTFNFLLVCRYWFDVAVSTPSLWAFWGTSLRECVVFHRYSGAVPLYLNLLDVNSDREIRDARGVLEDLSVQRRILHLHIHAPSGALAKILFFMSTPHPEVDSQIESLILMVEGPWSNEHPEGLPDITNFLNANSFPELRLVRLRGCSLRWESLILRTSGLTHLFIHAAERSKRPTVLELASLFARNSALEEIDLSLEVVLIPDGSWPSVSISILLPHLRRLVVHGNATGYAQLLNLLRFSNKLKHVKADLLLDGIVVDVAAALTPFLPNLFLASPPSNLAIHIVYALVGLSINVSRSGERGDAEDFLMLRISSLDMGFWEVAPTLPEEVARRLPTANVTSLSIRRYSPMFRQDFRRLFQMVSAVQEFRATDSAIGDVVQVLASPPSTGDGGDATPLPYLHTIRLKDINFASTSHVGLPISLGQLLEQRHRDGLPLSKLSMTYCPHISSDVCSGFARYLKDHLCWDHYEAAGDRQRVCGICRTRWSDLDY